MKKKKLAAMSLALTISLSLSGSLLSPFASAEYSVKDKIAQVSTFEDFQSATQNRNVETIAITSDLELTDNIETDKQIQVNKDVTFSIADGVKLIATADTGGFHYADLESGDPDPTSLKQTDMEGFRRLAEQGISLLIFNGDTGIIQEMYGSISDAKAALRERQWTTVVLADDMILDEDATVGNLFVLNGHSLGIEKNAVLSVENGFVDGDIIKLSEQELPENLKYNGQLITNDPEALEVFRNNIEIKSIPEPDINQITNPFFDVEAEKYYYQPVLWAVSRGIAAGKSETIFSPDETCTIAHMITFLWRAYDKVCDNQNNQSDSQNAIQWAERLGMIPDITELQQLDQPCTRAMAVMLFWKAAGSPQSEATTTIAPMFVDIIPGSDCAQAVAWAVETGITNGTSENIFSPDKICTRGNIITFLYRGLNP